MLGYNIVDLLLVFLTLTCVYFLLKKVRSKNGFINGLKDAYTQLTRYIDKQKSIISNMKQSRNIRYTSSPSARPSYEKSGPAISRSNIKPGSDIPVTKKSRAGTDHHDNVRRLYTNWHTNKSDDDLLN